MSLSKPEEVARSFFISAIIGARAHANLSLQGGPIWEELSDELRAKWVANTKIYLDLMRESDPVLAAKIDGGDVS